MDKSQCRNIKNIKKQGNMTPQMINSSIITDPNIIKVDKIHKEFKRMIIKMMTSKRIQIDNIMT